MAITQISNNVILDNTIAPGKLTVSSNLKNFLTNPTSANFIVSISGTTGSGNLVFGSSPTLFAPVFVSPISATISGATTANGSITVQGTSNATRTTSNVDLQPSGGGVTIGGTTRNASAIFQINSTTLGFLPPVMTSTQRNAISSPASGLVVYSSDLFDLSLYNGTSWGDVLTTHAASFTSDTLRTAVSDETGTGSLVFATSPTLTSPTIDTSLVLNATSYTYGTGAREALLNSMSERFVYKDGLVPYAEIFEDFPHFGTGGAFTIGTHGWQNNTRTAGTGLNTFFYTAASSSTSTKYWGVIGFTTANTVNAVNSLILGPYNGHTSSPFNNSIQACFCVSSASFCRFYLQYSGGGTDIQLRVNFETSTIELFRSGAAGPIVLVSGLSLSAGDFISGTRYRLFFKPISTSQTEVYFASAPWNSSIWTTIVNQTYTHTAYDALGWNCTSPNFGIVTTEAASKTAYVDWIAIRQEIQR